MQMAGRAMRLPEENPDAKERALYILPLFMANGRGTAEAWME